MLVSGILMVPAWIMNSTVCQAKVLKEDAVFEEKIIKTNDFTDGMLEPDTKC